MSECVVVRFLSPVVWVPKLSTELGHALLHWIMVPRPPMVMAISTVLAGQGYLVTHWEWILCVGKGYA
jgi:hypothetical protein